MRTHDGQSDRHGATSPAVRRNVPRDGDSLPAAARRGDKPRGSKRRGKRGGVVELEAVMITGVTIPLAVALFYAAARAFTYLYELIAGLVGWPYL